MTASLKEMERPAAMTRRRPRLTRDTPAGGTRGGGVDQDQEFNSSSSPPPTPSLQDPGRVARAGARETGIQEGVADLDGVELLEAQEIDGRCRVAFAGAPPVALRSDLRAAGFRFSPSSRAWVTTATARSRAQLARLPATEARQPSLPVSRPTPRPSPAMREQPRRPSTPPPTPAAAAASSGQPAWWRPILAQLVDWYGQQQAAPLTRAAVTASEGSVTLTLTDEMDALLIRKNLIETTTRLVVAGGAGQRVDVRWRAEHASEAPCP